MPSHHLGSVNQKTGWAPASGKRARLSRLERIFETRFESSFADALRAAPLLNATPVPVARVKALTEEVIERLLDRKICAIHIRGYCDPRLAKKASGLILKHRAAKVKAVVPTGTAETDTEYAMGVPSMIAARNPKHLKNYHKKALMAARQMRQSFAPMLSPLDRLRLELDEIWSPGATVRPFQEKKGLPGIIFIKRPGSRYQGPAAERGLVHVDAGVDESVFSANTYLSVPKGSGQLRLWTIPLDGRTDSHPLYQLIKTPLSFDSDVQEVIHTLLPEPVVISPSPGDLVIFDTSRPHAVAEVRSGVRISLQSFVVATEDRHLLMGS